MCSPEEIGNDEIICRRVSANSGWYDPVRGEVKPEAFKPRVGDEGVSVDRLASDVHPNFRSTKESAAGQAGKEYYAVCLSVASLREHGIEVVSQPLGENPGHAEIVDLTYENRKSDSSLEIMTFLAHEAVLRVEGPFLSN